MIKDELEVELYILNCSAGYDQGWGRSRIIYWTVGQDMIKDEVGVELCIEL